MDKAKKDVVFKFRFTKEELEIIKNKAQKLNITDSQYLRNVAMNKIPLTGIKCRLGYYPQKS